MTAKIKLFRSQAGLDILVGQDDASNDLLSLRLAHANDIWFHVSGAPGSHVVLRCGEEKVTPDKEALKEAAGLAAWFSKMRRGGKINVNYCLAKHVGKPRGAKPGTVSISKAKKLVVQPKLLQEVPD